MESATVQCPYCWEYIDVDVDPSVEHQEYIEDCSVCCRPIHLVVDIPTEGNLAVQAYSEDD